LYSGVTMTNASAAATLGGGAPCHPKSSFMDFPCQWVLWPAVYCPKWDRRGCRRRRAVAASRRFFAGVDGSRHAHVNSGLSRPPLVVDFGGNRIARRRNGQEIGDEALVPAAHRMVQREAVVRAPVPGERDSPSLGLPVPLRLTPKIGDAVAKTLLVGLFLVEIRSRAQQTLKEKRALHKSRAVVLAAERQGGAGASS
jgi:hypothetical protein